MAQLNHDLDKYLDTNLVYNDLEEWLHAPCWHKIYTSPGVEPRLGVGLSDRITFINKIVGFINRDNKSEVIDAYVRLVLQWCGLPFKSTDMLSYINSLGRNINYYPDNIHLIDGFDIQQTKKFLSEDVMDMFKDEVERIMREKIKQRRRVSSTTDTGIFDGEGLGSEGRFVDNGGKIRSAKRRPRRKSSTIKRRRRRTSRK